MWAKTFADKNSDDLYRSSSIVELCNGYGGFDIVTIKGIKRLANDTIRAYAKQNLEEMQDNEVLNKISNDDSVNRRDS